MHMKNDPLCFSKGQVIPEPGNHGAETEMKNQRSKVIWSPAAFSGSLLFCFCHTYFKGQATTNACCLSRNSFHPYYFPNFD